MKATEAKLLSFLQKAPQFIIEALARAVGDTEPVEGFSAVKLVVVDIALSRDQDNPQLIFESMNSTGKELSQADLVRNYILMGLEPGLQTRLYEEYWRPMELDFGQEAYGTQLEAYVFRRAICTIPTNSMNKTFATFGKALRKVRCLESIKAHFLLLPSYRRFPSDDEFRRGLHTRDLYNFRSRSYWLRRLENHGRKERVPVDQYTIEHILPQNPELSAAWRQELGDDWQRVQQQWLHTLGNLTLTGYNAEYSDRPFAEKRDMEGGFAESPLRLNAGLGKLAKWDDAAIQSRAGRLADQALAVWPAPSLDAATLAAYQPEKGAVAGGYSITDHPHLLTAGMRELFEAFRREVLALDPCVTEEFLKLYVAYKAETNFVDVVPLSKLLRLTLNMAFADVVDPRSVCRDVTGRGRWGNGDVEVGLTSLEDLPYVMGLVRQSYEQQMGDGERL